MRIISIILLVQILLLSSISCADALESFSHDTIVKTAVDTAPDSAGDTCSPFCTCVCCIGCTHPLISKGYFVKPLLPDHSNNYLEPSYHTIYKSVFQPPRA